MGRTKFRTKRGFVGGRKKSTMRRVKKEILGNIAVVPSEATDVNVVQQIEDEITSTSARKLRFFNAKEHDEDQNINVDSYAIVQESMLSELISTLLCPTCNNPGVIFVIKKGFGFAAKGELVCKICEARKEGNLCSKIDKSSSGFDINIRTVLAFRGIGCGLSAIRHWCGMMNLPYSVSQNLLTKATKKIKEGGIETFRRLSEKSQKYIRDAYAELGTHPDNEGILDISVSFDGAWQKRGHSSHNGMASIFDLVTGLPLDYEVLSNYCNKCKILEGKPEVDPGWKERHMPNCEKNFEGSANAMEVECAKRIWQRSVEQHKFRYTTVLCDGDSKAFDAVVASNVYGDDVNIQKEDCINHVAKRMGTALRNLVDSTKAQQQPISGKGKLTKEKIGKIQNYYGRAIKEYSSDVDLLQNRIMGILLHLSSTDNSPKHAHCPPGQSSWCFWQRSLAKSEQPGLHKDHETLPPNIGQKLVPIFRRLSDKDLLARCARAKTQNNNESFHQLIWKFCPKAVYVGRRTMETAVILALCQFTMGATFNITLCEVLGLSPGQNLEASAIQRNEARIAKAQKASSKKSRDRRKRLKFKKGSKERQSKDMEGVMYAAGGFNN